ncbi:MAG: ATP-dependent protease [Chloroflexi bacterium]|nr:ATP-dependent protease [Chloroflexota bacterium]
MTEVQEPEGPLQGELPLFPLDVVLFPGMLLPLHIFEDRYRLMISECLQGERHFGVLMATVIPRWRGTEYQHSEERTTQVSTIGTSARITHVQHREDGRMDIVTAGQERFRLLQILCTEPYIVGRIETYPLEDRDSPQVRNLANRVTAIFVRYLRLAGEVLGTSIEVASAPRDRTSLAYLMAMSLQIPLHEKQSLLDAADVPALLNKELCILSREEILLNLMRQAQQDNKGYVRGVSLDLSLS